MHTFVRRLVYLLVGSILVLCLSSFGLGQGRGRGGGVGGGRGSGGGMGNGGGPPSGVGVDRGLGNASERSGGRSDRGLENASMKSNGRSDAGLDRARQHLRDAEQDLQEHPGIPRALHVNANTLRTGYQAALATNPNLTFGNFVAATRLSQNLGPRFPGITRDGILSGLASGRSIGRTLQDLGLGEQQAKDAEKQMKEEIKQAKKTK